MQGIEFEDEKELGGYFTNPAVVAAGKPSFMVRNLEKLGIKDKSTANLVLLVIALVFFALTIFLYARTGTTSTKKLSAEEVMMQLRVAQEMQNVK